MEVVYCPIELVGETMIPRAEDIDDEISPRREDVDDAVIP